MHSKQISKTDAFRLFPASMLLFPINYKVEIFAPTCSESRKAAVAQDQQLAISVSPKTCDGGGKPPPVAGAWLFAGCTWG